jgi:hypothetical protein
MIRRDYTFWDEGKRQVDFAPDYAVPVNTEVQVIA